jgi:alginate O-acetyltransferase complex protein AlgI
MLFSSIIFLVYFLPVFLLVYLATGLRTAVLLTGSVIFYVWGEGGYIFLLIGLIIVNYVLAHLLSRYSSRRRLIWLIAALCIDLGVLATFKYAAFIAQIANSVIGEKVLPELHLRLPLGISFFTFQLISYLLDVYRSRVETEKSVFRFATYILMFPHLIAGPIVRYANIRDELVHRNVNRDRFGLGLQYLIVGLCQKVLIANTVAPLADYAFNLSGTQLDTGVAWLGILAYTLQIYFDFCGYSNMAIGLAFLLGFTFPKNFDYPYAARSMTEFWRKWHMSLSFWFRDYVYIPLGGNRGGPWLTLRNLIVVFFLTGLWHGAAWNFVFWGLFHGAFLLLERLWLGERLARTPPLFSWIYTMLVVMVGWVFFRAGTFSGAFHYVAQMFNPTTLYKLSTDVQIMLTPELILACVAGALFSFPTLPAILGRLGKRRVSRSPAITEERLDTLYVHALPTPALMAGLLIACALLSSGTLNPFLYFRF